MTITSLPTTGLVAIAPPQPLALSQSNSSISIGGVTIPAATATAAGVLDSARATKVDGLATVASSGNYSDLSNPPSIAIFPATVAQNSTNNALILTSNGFTQANGVGVTFIPPFNNTGPTTISINGQVFNAFTQAQFGAVACKGGEIVLGQAVIAVFDGTQLEIINPANKTSTIINSIGYVNKIRNPSMDLWLRGTSLTVSTSGQYTSDGHFILPIGASCSVQQQSGRQLTEYSLQITGNTGVSDIQWKQPIESLMAAPLSGQNVLFQCQLFNNTGGPITPTLTVKHPTVIDNYTSNIVDVSATNLQLCPVGVWTQLSFAWNASSNSTLGMELVLDFGNNFNTNTKTIQITEMDLRVATGIGIGLISNPPFPELRPIGVEIPLNARFFQNAGDGWTGCGESSSSIVLGGRYAHIMRAVPVATFTNFSPQIRDAATFRFPGCTGATATLAADAAIVIFTGGSGNVAQRPIQELDGTGFMQVSAEIAP